MESSSSTMTTARSQPSLSPRSQELRSLLPSVNVTRLPASVTNLVGCVGHEIEMIEEELNRYYGSCNEEIGTLKGEQIESLEDAIDDGFMCVDLRVLERKLEVWHRLFSPSFYNSSNNNNNNNNENLSTRSSNNLDYTVTPFFAVKCNPDPVVVEWLARSASHANLPLGFDCASIAELELAKKHVEKYCLPSITGPWGDSKRNSSTSVPITRIVYANPQRAEADLMRALELFATPIPELESPDSTSSCSSKYDLWLTLDGVEEVYKIAIARKRFLEKHNLVQCSDQQKSNLVMPRIRIILRIWVPDGHSQVPLGEKFGMRLDEIDSVLETCLEQGIHPREIIGISFHCGSGCESVETYLEALEMGKTALAAMDEKLREQSPSGDQMQLQLQTHDHRCWLVDIGGGFPGLDGLYGDEGRFSAAGELAASSQYTIEEKKEPDDATPALPTEPTRPKTTVADIAVAVRPLLQSFAASDSDSDVYNDRTTMKESSQLQEDQQNEPPLTLIAEPGRYFVEGAFALASRIYQKQILQEASTKVGSESKASDGNNSIRTYRIPHGVQGVFKDVLLCGESFVPQPLQTQRFEGPSSTNEDEEATPLPRRLYLSRVLGPSGDDSEDVVCDSCWLPELSVGDWLVFDRMGAYTLSIASRAGRPVMRYVIGGGSEIVKNKKLAAKTQLQP